MQTAQDLWLQVEAENEWKELQEKYGQDSYNPQFDFLLQYPNGQTLSSVYGKIWRYCQMDKKHARCEISIQRIANEINVGYSTAKRAIDWLCENGLVYDITPDVGRNIHKYGVNEEEHLIQTVAYNQFRKDSIPTFKMNEA